LMFEYRIPGSFQIHILRTRPARKSSFLFLNIINDYLFIYLVYNLFNYMDVKKII